MDWQTLAVLTSAIVIAAVVMLAKPRHRRTTFHRYGYRCRR
jgi:hypothetical protein